MCSTMLRSAGLCSCKCCAVLCCAVLCCAVLCCAVHQGRQNCEKAVPWPWLAACKRHSWLYSLHRCDKKHLVRLQHFHCTQSCAQAFGLRAQCNAHADVCQAGPMVWLPIAMACCIESLGAYVGCDCASTYCVLQQFSVPCHTIVFCFMLLCCA